MITDRDTNTIYVSERLAEKNIEFFEIFRGTLKQFDIEPDSLPKTADIWARDYMPIQINANDYIEYRYDPDYLQGKAKGRRDLKTYPDLVRDAIGLRTIKSDTIMDGGNCVKSSGCIILTDKIVGENKHIYSKNELVKKLHDTFQADKVILIPRDEEDEYGHADGMLRFIDNENVLINSIYREERELEQPLRQAGIKFEYLNYIVKNQNPNLNWAYINFLQTKDLILLPELGIDEDEQALEQLKQYYPEYAGKDRIHMVKANDIVEEGGGLNCVTWTIRM